jgi:type I restriction enzyme S subunit
MAYQIQGARIRNWLVQHATGTTMASLNQNVIERIPIVVPPLADQEAIAHILGTLDDNIELNRRMNETLEAIAQAIFKSWFVDFDPVRAKASGEASDSICHRLGLTPGLLALFPDSLQEYEVGEVPRGWQASSMSTKRRSTNSTIRSKKFLKTKKMSCSANASKPVGPR